MSKAVRRVAVSAARVAKRLLGQGLALLTLAVALVAFSPSANAQTYSYTGGGQTIVYNGAYSYWPGFSLFGESAGSGDNVSYFAFTIPAGKTYTTASLDYGYTQHSGGIHAIRVSALSGQPPATAAGINAIRTGTALATFPSSSPGPVSLPASVVTQMNSISGSGGGTLYIGAAGPLGQDYFGEFYQANLVGETMEPSVTGLSPTQGPTAGGTSVVITGTNLTGATMVTFAGTVATYVVNSATQITATAPTKTSGNADVRVTTAYGTSANTPADNFTYIAAPTVTSITPATGSTGGGTSVTITGTNLAGATAVTFGATPATGFAVNSNTQITATAPAGSAGTIDIRVTTSGGTSATSAADQFTYAGAPTVTSITPTAGPTGGGTTVIITGTGFSGASAVTFGATGATGYTINSATQITATAPAGTGTIDVRVTNVAGTSAISAADQFTYVAAPTVTSISPTSGPGGGGTTVTITGTNFSSATAVTFGATAATGYTVNSATQITATSPAGSGTVDVRVTTAGGTSATSAADQFTYIPAPTVTSVSPTAGPTGGGTSVTITGTNFTGVTAVTFGATAATGFTFINGTTITATSPAGSAGTVDIRVTTGGGTSATSAADQFTRVNAPTVTSVSPTAGPTGGGQTVTITGTGFAAAAGTGAVKFGATNATYTINSNTQITATSPANSAGTYDVTVTTVGGTSATSAADQYTYVAAPTVTSISPTAGPTSGGTYVMITGTGFSGATAVTFGATSATGITVVNPTTITASSPAGTGTVDVRVTTPGGTSATSAADQFTYIPAPTVTSISPTAGPTGGGTSVTITGTNFTGATAVTFGATAATGFTFINGTTITATSPTGSAGTVDIRVTTGGGTSATSAADQFTYVGAPTVTGISPTAGATAGGTTVTITGTRLSGATAVTFGATPATGYTVNSATQITATAPAGTGTVDVRVTTVGGISATSAADQYTYVAAPVAAGVTGVAVGFNTATAIDLAASITGAHSSIAIGTAPAHGTTSIAGDFVTYTPANNYAGADSFTYTATNAGGTSAPATVSLTVSQGAQTISFSALSNASLSASPLSLSATSDSGLTVSFVSTTPTFCTVSGTTLTLLQMGTCSIDAEQAGDASWAAAPTVTRAFTILPATLTIATNAASGLVVGEAYSQSNPASGGIAPYSYSLGAGAFPPGTTVDPTNGTVSGTPTIAGTFSYIIRATDSQVAPVSVDGSVVTVTIAAPTIVVAPATLNDGQIAVAYSETVTSTGGLGAKSYAVTAGSLPPGLTLDPSGGISGAPTGAGTYNFTLTATHSAGAAYTGSRAYAVTIAAPTLTLSPTLANAATAAAYNEAVVATGGTAPYSYAVTAGALPSGLTLSPTGSITGTPTASGVFNVSVTATDSSTGTGAPFSISRAYAITVGAPTITVAPTALPDATQEVAYSQTVTATGGTSPYSYAVTAGALPVGLNLSLAGDLTGTPTVNGTFNFTVTATDSTTGGGPAIGARAYALVVALPAPPTAGPVSPTVAANSGGDAITLNLTGTTATSIAVVTPPAHGSTAIAGLVITYTPSAGYSGSDSFTYTATNAGGTSAPATASITVSPPTLTLNAINPAGVATVAYSAPVIASLGMNPYSFAIDAGALPNGITLSPTGDLAGTPSATGTFNFTIRATDTYGATGTRAYAITIAAPTVAITSPSAGGLGDGSAGLAYSRNFTATGGLAPHRFAVTAGALPAGMVLQPGGALTGTPTVAGTFNFSVTATDSSGGSGPYSSPPVNYSVTIAAPTIVIDQTSLPAATTVVAYSQTITSSGGVGAMTYAVTAGALPTGLTLAPGGLLSGAPTQSGTFSFTITATDSLGFTGARALSLTITDPVIAVTAPAAGALPAGQGGVAYSQTFTATGGQGTHSFVLAGGVLPAGLTLSSEGVLSGTPTTAGDYSFAIRATDESPAPGPFSSPAVNYTLQIIIAVPVVQPKTATVIGGQSVTIDVAAGAVGFELASVAVASPPSHGTAVVSGMTIVYTADGAYSGADSFTYTVSNAGGASLPGTVSITVNPAVVAGPPKTATIMAGQTATVELTEGATGAPFTAAAVVSLSPAGAGTATISPRTGPAGQLFDLIFTPDNAFTGQAVVTYTLSNAFATSAPGTVTITVERRPDPTVDPEVTGLLTSQTETARRFATAQISNINRRLERLHDGGTGGGGFSSSVSLGFGAAMASSMASDPSELRKMQDTYGVIGGLTGTRLGYDGGAPSARTEDLRASAPGGNLGDGEGSGPWGVWVSGAANFGTTDAAVDREGFEFSTDGLSIGADRRLSDSLVFGMAAGWAHDVSKIGDNGTRSQADAWSLSLYGSYQPVEKAYIDLVLGYGRLDFDSRRYVTANGDFAYGSREGDQWFGAVTAGWDYKHAHGLHLSPYGRIEATRSLLDGFTEQGGGVFALAYEEQTTTTVTGALGLRGDYAFKTGFGQAIPNFRIEYAYDLQGTGTARLRYADWLDGEVYELGATPLDKNRMLYGVGLDLIRRSGMRFGLDYEGMLSGDQTSSTVRIQLETPF